MIACCNFSITVSILCHFTKNYFSKKGLLKYKKVVSHHCPVLFQLRAKQITTWTTKNIFCLPLDSFPLDKKNYFYTHNTSSLKWVENGWWCSRDLVCRYLDPQWKRYEVPTAAFTILYISRSNCRIFTSVVLNNLCPCCPEYHFDWPMKISGTAGANHWSSLLDWSPNSSFLPEKRKEKSLSTATHKSTHFSTC